ncbi:hypothetical protein F3Y22_tig00112044pilonHSYRG00154 [Hibiscus syriacus]|uniref:Uncharacterized protein n=1 Tax=Hibiscus syriacus TaxID=106335 RepID=A0A6A2X6M5_HIBSY|nr:hypothetical protein F3Y22_tig00112044pilonHSYRG00154 [Hibiscus syriacus]
MSMSSSTSTRGSGKSAPIIREFVKVQGGGNARGQAYAIRFRLNNDLVPPVHGEASSSDERKAPPTNRNNRGDPKQGNLINWDPKLVDVKLAQARGKSPPTAHMQCLFAFYNLNQSLVGTVVPCLNVDEFAFPVQVQVTCRGLSVTFTFDHVLALHIGQCQNTHDAILKATNEAHFQEFIDWIECHKPGLMLPRFVLGREGPALDIDIQLLNCSPVLGMVSTAIKNSRAGYMNQKSSARATTDCSIGVGFSFTTLKCITS